MEVWYKEITTPNDFAEGASDQHLPTMRDALDGLRDMEASVFHSTNYLITQVTTCTPFQEKATLIIFEPFRDAVVDFLIPVVEAWSHVAPVVSYLASLPAPPSSWIAGKYYSMGLNAQSARSRLSNLDEVVASVEVPLLDQLRGPWGLEQLFRVLKWLGISSTRVDILDSLHQLLLKFRAYCVRTMRYLDVIEQFVVGLHDFFRDDGRVRALNEREEVCRRLHDLSRSATKSMQYAPSHPYMLGLKGSEVSVRSDYKGRGHLREDSAFSRIIP